MQRQLAVSLILLVLGGITITARAQQPSPLEPAAPAAVPRAATLMKLLPTPEAEVQPGTLGAPDSLPIAEFWEGRLRVERVRRAGSSGLFFSPASSVPLFYADPVQAISMASHRDERYGLGLWFRWGGESEQEALLRRRGPEREFAFDPASPR